MVKTCSDPSCGYFGPGKVCQTCGNELVDRLDSLGKPEDIKYEDDYDNKKGDIAELDENVSRFVNNENEMYGIVNRDNISKNGDRKDDNSCAYSETNNPKGKRSAESENTAIETRSVEGKRNVGDKHACDPNNYDNPQGRFDSMCDSNKKENVNYSNVIVSDAVSDSEDAGSLAANSKLKVTEERERKSYATEIDTKRKQDKEQKSSIISQTDIGVLENSEHRGVSGNANEHRRNNGHEIKDDDKFYDCETWGLVIANEDQQGTDIDGAMSFIANADKATNVDDNCTAEQRKNTVPTTNRTCNTNQSEANQDKKNSSDTDLNSETEAAAGDTEIKTRGLKGGKNFYETDVDTFTTTTIVGNPENVCITLITTRSYCLCFISQSLTYCFY